MSKTFKYYWPAILWAFFILVICNMSLGKIGESSRFFPGFDKLTHCGLFFTMTVLYCSGYLRAKNLSGLSFVQAFFITLAIIFYGGVIEVVQKYIFVWRSGDWNDLFADGVGACMGIFSIMVTIASTKNGKN